MKVLSHKSESVRLEKLRGFEILDTPRERVFDRIVLMTARVFSVKQAVLSFVDEHRVWYKSKCGLRGLKEVSREVTFCSHVILSDEVLVVEDTTMDPRFVHFSGVAGYPTIRFYAGAPLISDHGYRLGSLCVMSREPRAFSKTEGRVLKDLAAIVVDEMRLRRAAGHLRTEARGRKESERTLAKQHRLLQRLSGSLEDKIQERTVELTHLNESLNAEVSRRERIERDRFDLLHLIEESPDFIALATIDGSSRYLNQAGIRMVGLGGLEQAVQTPFIEYFLPEDRVFVNETVLPALQERGHWEGDFRFLHFKTGLPVPVNWNIFYVRDPATGEPISLATIARDVTERQRTDAALRESQKRFRHLVEQAGEAFFLCDLDRFIVDVNQEACDSLGYRREELLGLPVATVETTCDPAEALPRWPSWQPDVAVNTRGIHRRKDGTTFPVETRVSSILTDGRRYMLALVRDVTERHRADAALHKAKEEAEKANQAKSEFLSRMSHELRTPLNAILGFGQILLAQSADALQKDCANHVVNAGNHLLGLINEVLDIAGIEAGRVELSLEPVRVESLVAETLDLIQPQARDRRITFEVRLADGGNHYLLADRQRCKQVLLNLLSNAVKYSPEAGHVLIDCRAVRPRGLRLCVTDAGPGIATDKLERLFVAFDRLGAERSSIPGIGLGLSLSKHLIEAMGGSIGVNSAPGEGSTFWLQLPRHRGPVRPGLAPLLPLHTVGPAGSSVPTEAGSASPTGATVLCIEDNVSNLRLIVHLFSRVPRVRLLTARSGEEGLVLARRHQPHLVLLDLRLPDIPGSTVLSRLKPVGEPGRSPWWCSVPTPRQKPSSG